MFKLVVLCAFFAAAAAEPNHLIAPLVYSTSVISPARTTITNQASSVIHPSPALYSTPLNLVHLIKKRSILTPLIAPTTYIAPSTYISHAPLATTYTAPLAYTAATHLATTYAAPVYTAAAHLIKKRSAPLIVPATYLAPRIYNTAPLLTSTYAAAPIISTPYISTAPIAYSHLIKKRSLPLAIAAYAAPAAISHQSRVDINTTPAVASYSYSAPSIYAHPLNTYVL